MSAAVIFLLSMFAMNFISLLPNLFAYWRVKLLPSRRTSHKSTLNWQFDTMQKRRYNPNWGGILLISCSTYSAWEYPKCCFSFGVSCVDGVCNCCIYIKPQLILANTCILSIVCVQSSGVKVGIIGGDWGGGGGGFQKKKRNEKKWPKK